MTKSYVNNTSDELQIKDAEDKVKYNRRQEIDDLKHILSLPQGKRFLLRYLYGVCGILKPVYTGNSETYFLDGKRAVGLILIEEIKEVDTKSFIEMITKNIEAIV